MTGTESKARQTLGVSLLHSHIVGKKLFALFTIVPLIELSLLVVLGDAMGIGTALLLVMTTGLVGAVLAQREGLRVLDGWRAAMAKGAIPADGVMTSALVLLGGVLLVTPGVLTDALGMALLLPTSRRWIARRVQAQLEQRMQISQGFAVASFFADPREPTANVPNDVIDVDAEEQDVPAP